MFSACWRSAVCCWPCFVLGWSLPGRSSLAVALLFRCWLCVLIGSRWPLFGYRFVFAARLSRSWLRIDVGSCLAAVRLLLFVCGAAALLLAGGCCWFYLMRAVNRQPLFTARADS